RSDAAARWAARNRCPHPRAGRTARASAPDCADTSQARPVAAVHPCRNPRPMLLDRHDIYMPRAAEHLDTDVVGVPLEQQVDGGLTHAEIEDAHPAEKLGQQRSVEHEPPPWCVDADAERALEQHEHGAGGPG